MFSFADFIQTTWLLNLSIRVNDFLRTRVTDSKESEESTSWDRLTSLIAFFSALFRVITSSLSISAWISILMIKFDFPNLLTSATVRSHIRLHSISKKSSIDCWKKVPLITFVLIKMKMSLIVQSSLLSFFFSIVSCRLISNIDTSKSLSATSKMIVAHTIFLSTRNVVLIIARELTQTSSSSSSSSSIFNCSISNNSRDISSSDSDTGTSDETRSWTKLRGFRAPTMQVRERGEVRITSSSSMRENWLAWGRSRAWGRLRAWSRLRAWARWQAWSRRSSRTATTTAIEVSFDWRRRWDMLRDFEFEDETW